MESSDDREIMTAGQKENEVFQTKWGKVSTRWSLADLRRLFSSAGISPTPWLDRPSQTKA